MVLSILAIVVVALIPVAIGWRVAFEWLNHDPTPLVKGFFWVLSALFILLAGAAFVATRFIE